MMKCYEVSVKAESWADCREVDTEAEAMDLYNKCVRNAVANNSLRVALRVDGETVAEWTREAWLAEDDED